MIATSSLVIVSLFKCFATSFVLADLWLINVYNNFFNWSCCYGFNIFFLRFYRSVQGLPDLFFGLGACVVKDTMLDRDFLHLNQRD